VTGRSPSRMVRPSTLLPIPSCVLICVYIAEYARAHQRREEEELDIDRE
jgi:hypothetical protein